MNAPEIPDPIDKLLREQDTYLADDGFTRRVMAGVTVRKRFFGPRIILFVAIVVGILMAVFWMPWSNLPPLDYTQIFSDNSKVLSAWLPVFAVGVVLGSAILALFRREN